MTDDSSERDSSPQPVGMKWIVLVVFAIVAGWVSFSIGSEPTYDGRSVPRVDPPRGVVPARERSMPSGPLRFDAIDASVTRREIR